MQTTNVQPQTFPQVFPKYNRKHTVWPKARSRVKAGILKPWLKMSVIPNLCYLKYCTRKTTEPQWWWSAAQIQPRWFSWTLYCLTEKLWNTPDYQCTSIHSLWRLIILRLLLLFLAYILKRWQAIKAKSFSKKKMLDRRHSLLSLLLAGDFGRELAMVVGKGGERRGSRDPAKF